MSNVKRSILRHGENREIRLTQIIKHSLNFIQPVYQETHIEQSSRIIRSFLQKITDQHDIQSKFLNFYSKTKKVQAFYRSRFTKKKSEEEMKIWEESHTLIKKKRSKKHKLKKHGPTDGSNKAVIKRKVSRLQSSNKSQRKSSKNIFMTDDV